MRRRALLLLLSCVALLVGASRFVQLVHGPGYLAVGENWTAEQVLEVQRRWPDRYLWIANIGPAAAPGHYGRTKAGLLISEVEALAAGTGVTPRWAVQIRPDVLETPYTNLGGVGDGDGEFCKRDHNVCTITEYTAGTGGEPDTIKCTSADFGSTVRNQARGYSAWIEDGTATGTLHPTLPTDPLPPLVTQHSSTAGTETLLVEDYDWTASTLGRAPRSTPTADLLYVGGRGCSWPGTGDGAPSNYNWAAWAHKVDTTVLQERLDREFDLRPYISGGDGTGESPFVEAAPDCCDHGRGDTWAWAANVDVTALLSAMSAYSGQSFMPSTRWSAGTRAAQPTQHRASGVYADVRNTEYQAYWAWLWAEEMVDSLRMTANTDLVFAHGSKARWWQYWDGGDSGQICGHRGVDDDCFSVNQPAMDCTNTTPATKYRSDQSEVDDIEGPLTCNPYGRNEAAAAYGEMAERLQVRAAAKSLHNLRVASDDTGGSDQWIDESWEAIGTHLRLLPISNPSSAYDGTPFGAGELGFYTDVTPNRLRLQNNGTACGAADDGTKENPDIEVCMDTATSLNADDGTWHLWCGEGCASKVVFATTLDQVEDACGPASFTAAATYAPSSAETYALEHDFGTQCGTKADDYTLVAVLDRGGFSSKVTLGQSFDPDDFSMGDLRLPIARVTEADGDTSWFSMQDNVAVRADRTVLDVTDQTAVNAATDPDCTAVSTAAGDDSANVQCLLDRVAADTELYFPGGGNYEVDAGSWLLMSRSNISIDGDGPGVTTIVMDGAGQNGSHPGPWARCASQQKLRISGGTLGSTQAWTSGYDPGDSVVGVTDASLFTVGEYVRLTITEDCERVPWQAGLNGCTAGNNRENFSRLAKIAARDTVADTLTLAIPLRVDYGDFDSSHVEVGAPVNPQATPYAPLVGWGISDLTFDFINQGTVQDYHERVCAEGVAEGWVTNVHFKAPLANALVLRRSVRNYLAFNRFSDQTHNSPSAGIGVTLNREQSQNNHWHANRGWNTDDLHYTQQGSHGTIFGWSYHEGFNEGTKCSLSHGEYVSRNLWEANTCEGGYFTSADQDWGASGVDNGWFRNRGLGSGGSAFAGVLGSEPNFDPGSMTYMAQATWFLLNSAWGYNRTIFCANHEDGACSGIDRDNAGFALPGAHFERNRSRAPAAGAGEKTTLVLGPAGTGATDASVHCGTDSGPGDCGANPGSAPPVGSNVLAATTPPTGTDWDSATFPFSMVRGWMDPLDVPGWCNELPRTGHVIGADVDSYTAGAVAASQKTPAHRLEDGDACGQLVRRKHEPAGYTVIFDEDWSTWPPPNPPWSDPAPDPPEANSSVALNTTKLEGDSVLRMTYEVGFVGGAAPTGISHELTADTYTKVHQTTLIELSHNFCEAPDTSEPGVRCPVAGTSTKMAYIDGDDTVSCTGDCPNMFIDLFQQGDVDPVPTMEIQFVDPTCGDGLRTGLTTYQLTPDTPVTMARGRGAWEFEVFAASNDAGVANGVLRLWGTDPYGNSTLILERTDLCWSENGVTWARSKLAPVIGGNSTGIEEEQWVDFHHFRTVAQ